MASPLGSVLESKLRLPRQVTRPMPRPQLQGLLDASDAVPLTLVSAPPGYGKTTLVAAWLAGRAPLRRFAWVSLSEQDRHPTSFWTYFLTAVERAAPGAGARALELLETGIDTALGELLNELSVLPDNLTIVLDDYHLCDGPDVQSGMTFLLDQLPPQVHLVVLSRADPNLPLPRLRGRGELVEVRASDLRFTPEESRAYLNDLNDLDLDGEAVAVLDGRTEGWAAAIQLAALSLRGRADPSGFIAEFAGDDRFVLDYLADEVLSRVPPETRRFLLQTSILDRLTGPLCDAVTGGAGGKAVLESLERQNLFLVPLDDQRRWYRYHHLFADVLNAHLLDETADVLPRLHQRASDWYAANDDPESAIRHALAAGDSQAAAQLVELAIPEVRRLRKEALILRWAANLPDPTVRNRPVLAMGIVGALMANNQFEGVSRRLDDIEKRLGEPDTPLIVDRGEFSRLPAVIETYRAALALTHGDLDATMNHARVALARAATGDLLSIAAASALIGLALWRQGDLGAAYAAYATSADHLGRADHVADVLGCTITLVDLATTQGRLRDAEACVHRALVAAQGAGTLEPVRGTADMHVAMSLLDLERNELASAAEHLRRADELGETGGLPQNAYRWRVALARLRAARGDTASAIELLDEAERVYVGDFSPDVRPIAATRARVLAAAGRIPEALRWASDSGLTTADRVSYLTEYEQVTLVRVQLAHAARSGSPTGDTMDLLERLIDDARTGGRQGSLVELLVLRSLACSARGQATAAAETLRTAVRLAEPEGYCRTFTSEGPAMATLLDAVGDRHAPWPYLQRLQAAMRGDESLPGSPDSEVGDLSTLPDSGGVAEPLSARELEILRYLGSELAGPAIARELSVSLSTVRTHTQHIYTKLGVNNRRAAIRRAHQLGLFSRGVRS
ncbi:MAG: helix-turn-helix transcriptional regulator [Propionibacteriaceae bacterium]|nr:helix-turn-helix transcriptional regulator [Propionibacteriaceae bacterium]